MSEHFVTREYMKNNLNRQPLDNKTSLKTWENEIESLECQNVQHKY